MKYSFFLSIDAFDKTCVWNLAIQVELRIQPYENSIVSMEIIIKCVLGNQAKSTHFIQWINKEHQTIDSISTLTEPANAEPLINFQAHVACWSKLDNLGGKLVDGAIFSYRLCKLAWTAWYIAAHYCEYKPWGHMSGGGATWALLAQWVRRRPPFLGIRYGIIQLWKHFLFVCLLFAHIIFELLRLPLADGRVSTCKRS